MDENLWSNIVDPLERKVALAKDVLEVIIYGHNLALRPDTAKLIFSRASASLGHSLTYQDDAVIISHHKWETSGSMTQEYFCANAPEDVEYSVSAIEHSYKLMASQILSFRYSGELLSGNIVKACKDFHHAMNRYVLEELTEYGDFVFFADDKFKPLNKPFHTPAFERASANVPNNLYLQSIDFGDAANGTNDAVELFNMGDYYNLPQKKVPKLSAIDNLFRGLYITQLVLEKGFEINPSCSIGHSSLQGQKLDEHCIRHGVSSVMKGQVFYEPKVIISDEVPLKER